MSNPILPLTIFYIVISINTFFSVRCFSHVIPCKNRLQKLIDTILFFCYVLMAVSVDKSLEFVFWTAVLFSVAVLKYVSLLSLVKYLGLLKYKIIIDGLGTVSCVLAMGGIIFGYEIISIWIWTALFVLANIFIFFVKPLYKIPD